MPMLDRLLTVEQAALKLHVSVKTIRSWRYKRRLPFTRVGRRIYIDAGVIEQLLEANVIEPLASTRFNRPAGRGGAQKGSAA